MRHVTWVNAITALVALSAVVISLMSVPGLRGYLGAGLALIAMAIAYVDARRFIIPDELSVAGLILALGNARVIAPYATPEAVGIDRKSTRLNSSHVSESRMPSSA